MAKIEVTSEVAGNVWKVQAKVGEVLAEEDVIMILESMKMEIPVEAPVAGKLVELLVAEEEGVDEDQVVAVIEN
jgi:acetyl-CoA carboxylase biotin carboxyl carrier protein|tara:strand:+ start:80 stop:301 length:222 start_codon:yes stop_codon:yes gene_type:complete